MSKQWRFSVLSFRPVPFKNDILMCSLPETALDVAAPHKMESELSDFLNVHLRHRPPPSRFAGFLAKPVRPTGALPCKHKSSPLSYGTSFEYIRSHHNPNFRRSYHPTTALCTQIPRSSQSIHTSLPTRPTHQQKYQNGIRNPPPHPHHPSSGYHILPPCGGFQSSVLVFCCSANSRGAYTVAAEAMAEYV